MKTLLLTLVVVTIVCLDFGYTIVCYKRHASDSQTTTCLSGICYKKITRGSSRPEMGCGCPQSSRGVKVDCCMRDKCNG
uniref:Alpha-neurotoxin homolog 7 n=1 Tax=Micrurus corallinus TaxID=54390 RepID=3SOC7_MICCO|nr:RecName: Full=Alpha-neurotoxin homolog 7; Short=NXH7; AltName: Full=Alpha-neurotoxin homolog 3; Short=NXH3; Flags: Precursor [Micrurus corallinus]AAF13251.1 alpha neurotoxin homolog 3 [Micrurus corallinus]AAF13252.1 alpha neurotoxin homolog 7 [Micrurus corallinus]